MSANSKNAHKKENSSEFKILQIWKEVLKRFTNRKNVHELQ